MGWTLVTNDDGIDAPGLHALAAEAVAAGLEVVVAAPLEQASGAGASIMASWDAGQIPVHRRELAGLPGVAAYAVAAQPAFISYAAVHGWFAEPPELVLSGINEGANLGHAVLHSGTVGAALTVSRFGVRALAVSLDCDRRPAGAIPRWSVAAGLVPEVLGLLAGTPVGTVLSLNVPDLPSARLGTLVAARLAPRGKLRGQVETRDGGHLALRLVEPNPPAGPDSDVALLAAGHPTLTALTAITEDPTVPLAELLSHP